MADYSTTVPNQSVNFTSFGTPAISGGNVAFIGSYSGGSGLFFSQNGGNLLDVIETGEPLFGSTVSAVSFAAATGLDGNGLAYSYTLASGVKGEGYFGAVPEPGTWASGALLVGVAGVSLRLRRRRAVRLA